MSRPRRDCLFCTLPADSKEHVFPASLGGRRKQRGLLCHGCNGRFARPDDALPRGLREICSVLGVRPDHKNQSYPARGRDRRLNRDFLYTPGGATECRTNEIRILRKGPGALVTYTGDKTYVRNVMNALQKIETEDPNNVGAAVESEGLIVNLQHKVRYNGRGFMRAIGRIALNHLACAFPDVARSVHLRDLKQYILRGRSAGRTIVWPELDIHQRWMVNPRSPFAHRVAVSLRADIGRIHAQVAIFSGFFWGVDLGPYDGSCSSTTVFEMDPLAEAPDDRRCETLPDVAAPISVAPAFTKFELDRSMGLLFRRLNAWSWKKTGNRLVADINATRSSVPAAERPTALARLLERERQRILTFLDRTVAIAPDIFGWDESRTQDRRRLRRLIAAKRGARFEIAPKTFRLVENLRVGLADAISRQLTYRPLGTWDVWMFLDGVLGAEVALPLLLEAARLPVERLSSSEIAFRITRGWIPAN